MTLIGTFTDGRVQLMYEGPVEVVRAARATCRSRVLTAAKQTKEGGTHRVRESQVVKISHQ